MSDDIDMKVGCDVTAVAAGMATARDELRQTITVIQEQHRTWIDFGLAAVQRTYRLDGLS
jgi:hypothetical protein